jgi:hypothetical protein
VARGTYGKHVGKGDHQDIVLSSYASGPVLIFTRELIENPCHILSLAQGPHPDFTKVRWKAHHLGPALAVDADKVIVAIHKPGISGHSAREHGHLDALLRTPEQAEPAVESASVSRDCCGKAGKFVEMRGSVGAPFLCSGFVELVRQFILLKSETMTTAHPTEPSQVADLSAWIVSVSST